MSWWVSIEGQPVVHDCPNCGGHEGEEVFSQNITYNVGTMLRRAGLYPRILNGMTVAETQPVLKNAVILMSENPEYFRQFNAKNGWGTFETTFVAVDNIYKALIDADDSLRLRWQ